MEFGERRLHKSRSGKQAGQKFSKSFCLFESHEIQETTVMLHSILYRMGDLLFSNQNDTWTLEKEFEKDLEDLEQRLDTMRVKDMTMCAQTASILLDTMEFEKNTLNDRQEQISSGLKEHVDTLVQTANEFLTTIGVVAALILSIGIPWVLTPLEQSTVLFGMPSSANTSDTDTSPDGNQGYSLAVANLIMVILMVVSVTASMLALVCSFGMYGSLNVSISEPLDRLWFLRKCARTRFPPARRTWWSQ